MAKPIDYQTEKKLIDALEDASYLIEAGYQPTDAFVKAASDADLTPAQIRLIVRAYNAGYSNAYVESGKSVLEKLSSFDVVDPEQVVVRVFGEEEKETPPTLVVSLPEKKKASWSYVCRKEQPHFRVGKYKFASETRFMDIVRDRARAELEREKALERVDRVVKEATSYHLGRICRYFEYPLVYRDSFGVFSRRVLQKHGSWVEPFVKLIKERVKLDKRDEMVKYATCGVGIDAYREFDQLINVYQKSYQLRKEAGKEKGGKKKEKQGPQVPGGDPGATQVGGPGPNLPNPSSDVTITDVTDQDDQDVSTPTPPKPPTPPKQPKQPKQPKSQRTTPSAKGNKPWVDQFIDFANESHKQFDRMRGSVGKAVDRSREVKDLLWNYWHRMAELAEPDSIPELTYDDLMMMNAIREIKTVNAITRSVFEDEYLRQRPAESVRVIRDLLETNPYLIYYPPMLKYMARRILEQTVPTFDELKELSRMRLSPMMRPEGWTVQEKRQHVK